MSKKYDVAIIGGGVIGSSVAHFLAERGYQVAIVEKQRIASEASKAAAGLLGVQAEWDAYDPLFELARKSRAIFPQLAAALREKTGIDIGYEEKGIYRIAQNEDEKTRILDIMDWQQKTGEESYFLTGDELYEKEPFLSSSIIGAVYYPKDGHVIAPELTKAFAHSAAISGADIYEQTEVFDIKIEDNRVVGIVTNEGMITCEKVVIAGGSWSTKLLHHFHSDWGTYPVKGEVVAVKSCKPLLQSPIFQERFYIAPKRGGRYVIGATMKPHTFTKSVQPESITSILERAYTILPALKEAEWESTWAGLRPQSNHEVPYMGAHEEIKGLYACTGHYRNGILLSPVSGQYMADLIEGKQGNYLLDSLVSKSIYPA
ncbi:MULTISPECIES: glycine oxidase ThiO [Bacillus]|uniref:glycine oxidase ThiO n=1 Tax=Bacillus TaxID=1386 RepID=UPI0002F1567F|nr:MULTISPECIES: glycine oxidase ThiO [Bacillus]MEB3054901.1 glycine oxidase ThiO [Bacillus pseudomycoides]MED1598917.1 glycine oxidase ThiO [Bacillus pseudomycoides]MED4709339.1 glycine oxidase ThiO [Bacillus pseudomycoides]OOR51427.1 glycine oxidase ThiO [Bacillus pseudomycoides]PDY10072.1 glycine oxidase ThiO [Bacillus pseudomycoides]